MRHIRTYLYSTLLIRAQAFMICGLFISSLLGCSDSRDPQTPEGALRLFGVALAEGDRLQIKSSLSAATHEALGEVLTYLRRINEGIKRFPSPEGQAWAKQTALGEQFSAIESISDQDVLFARLFKTRLEWARQQPSGEVEQGLNMRRLVSEDAAKDEVIILTRSDNQISMRKEGSRWVITSFEEPLQKYISALKASVKVLSANREEWLRRVKLNLNLPKMKRITPQQK